MRLGAFHRHELLPVQGKTSVHDIAFWFILPLAEALQLINARIFEDRGVILNCFLGFTRLVARKQEERDDPLRQRGLVKLPRYAIPVHQPAEFLAERIFVQLHQNGSTVGELLP